MVDNVDVTRPAPHAPLPPIDPNVRVPDSVLKAAALAESFYKQSAPSAVQPTAPVEPPVQPVVTPAPEPVVQAQEPPPQAPPVQPPAQVQPPATEPPAQTPDDQTTPDQWRHRYLSMKGRFDQSQQIVTAMQDQMQQLGDELMRTQRMIQGHPQQQQQPKPMLTEEDVQTYGPDLVNMVQRAAVQAVSPELAAVKEENNQLRQTVTQSQRASVHQVLDAKVPEWRQLNRDPRFLKWLSLPDIYSGQLRRNMLNSAFQAAHAPRVVAFFQGFLNEEAATGHVEAPVAGQQQVPTPAPRQAAVELMTLAAPGRPSPAGGQPPIAADKPIYTRAQIAEFYRHVREHRYAGREPEKSRIEADIFAAQREGRVR